MEIPQILKTKLQQKKEQERKERLREIEDEKKEILEKRKHKEKEKKLSSSKLKLSREIFKWAEEFRKTEEWKKLAKKAGYHGTYNAYLVNVGGWNCDPKTGKKSHKPLLHFDVAENEVVHRERWCWQGYTYDVFNNPEKMTKKLPHAYLKLVQKHLESGEVFNYLARGLNDD